MSLFHSPADSWPDVLEDSAARCVLDWVPQYDLAHMVEEMVERIRRTVEEEREREREGGGGGRGGESE